MQEMDSKVGIWYRAEVSQSAYGWYVDVYRVDEHNSLLAVKLVTVEAVTLPEAMRLAGEVMEAD